MKKEIFLKEELAKQILERFSKLDAGQKNFLSLLAIMGEKGIDRRDLHLVLDKVEPQLVESISVLLREGLILDDSADTIYCPTEVAMAILRGYEPPAEMVNCVVKALVNALQPWEYIDTVNLQPFFNMAEGIIDHLIEHQNTEGIDWLRFGQLVVRYVALWYELGVYETGILSKTDVLTMRAINLVKDKVKDDQNLYCKLICLEALLYIQGFEYVKGKALLAEAASLQDKPTALFYLVWAMYHLSYGTTITGLSFLYQAYQTQRAGESYLHSLIAAIIGYYTILQGCKDCTFMWLSKYQWSKLPAHSLITFFWHLTMAMLDNDEKEFLLAKDSIISPEASILGKLYGTERRYYEIQNQPRLAASYYKKYLNVIARFGSLDSGYYLLRATEVKRHVAANNLVTARKLLDKLNQVDLSCRDEDTSLSLRLHCSEAFYKYYFATGEYAMAKIYAEIALELLETYKSTHDAIKYASKISADSTVWDDGMVFNIKLCIIKADIEMARGRATEKGCLSRGKTPFKPMLDQLKSLGKQYPHCRWDADVVSAYIVSLTKPEKAVDWWHKIIGQTPKEERCRIAVEASRYAKGWIWESRDLLELANNYDSLYAVNEFERATFLMELASAIEQVGLRPQATSIWEEVYDLTEGTEMLAMAYFSAAYEAFEHETYTEALSLIKTALANYQQLESYCDETLASILCYKSVILSQLCRYKEARKAIQKAIRIYPDVKDVSAFNLFYNLGYYNMALSEWKAAREALDKAKSLRTSDYQREKLDGLYEILAKPLAERPWYFRPRQTESELDDIIRY